jgi:2-polyprenyl-6-methoxyphenol hydroxylase-like FAD-dependent oxidoreductase
MRIACVGGGPAGLYFAVVAKLRSPAREVVVFERNPPGTTYGWGVVYWDSLRHALHRVDPPSAREITARSVTWTGQQLRIGEKVVHLGGYGYSIERKQLLEVLRARAHQLGVQLRFEEPVDDVASIDADLVVAADGNASPVRSQRAEVFGTSVRTGANAYIWLGTSKEFTDFTFGCERTDAGWLWYHGYQFAEGASTVIVECSDPTWRSLGLDVLDNTAGLKLLSGVFERHLDGLPLLDSRPGQHAARWSHFPTVTNQRWHDNRVVLLGDAAHTAHYSIGSGTRLALEDAIALGDALSTPGLDTNSALHRYAAERRPEVARWQAEAAASASWFESMDDHLTHDPLDVAHALLGRRSADETASFAAIDRSSWEYRLLRATQNPALRRARWLVGSARRRRAAARIR